MIPTHLRSYISNTELFLTSITHRSYCNEHPRTQHNERLEFLGDAILEYLISKQLYEQFPDQPEGLLTAMRSKLVQTNSLSQIARQLKLGEYLRLSKGEEQGGGRQNSALLENALEALIGAVYMDGGMQTAHKFLKDHLFPQIHHLTPDNLKDPKSLFQELIQAQNLPTPTYQVIEEVGPDHNKIFTTLVLVNNQEWGRGQGSSKQRAQTSAAEQGLKRLEKNIQI